MLRLIIPIIGVLGLNELTKYAMLSEDNDIQKPVDTVSIVMPSFNEEKYIDNALNSIFNQSLIQQYPDMFEVVVVDGRSTDKTVEKALKYPIKMVYETRKGKLTARNTGVANSRGEIIVAADSDRIYNKSWLNALLKPFNDKEVVGVCGSSIWNFTGIHNFVQPLGYSLLWLLHPNRMDGGNSAYRKSTAPMFNESINQQDFWSVVQEEELGFGDKLSMHGKVVPVINATDIHYGSSKIACRISDSLLNECQLIGIRKDRM